MALSISVSFIYSQFFVLHPFVYPNLFPFMLFTIFWLYDYKPQYMIHGLYGLVSILFIFLCDFLLHDNKAGWWTLKLCLYVSICTSNFVDLSYVAKVPLIPWWKIIYLIVFRNKRVECDILSHIWWIIVWC